MSKDSQKQPDAQANEGEGNRTAARRYNDATQDFAQSGRVQEQARKATQMTDQEQREAQAAEQAGKARAKGEDPALKKRP